MDKLTIVLIFTVCILLAMYYYKEEIEDVSNIKIPSKGYLINLPRRLDRMEEFFKNVNNSDFEINIEKMEAVDGNSIDTSKLRLTHLAKQELKDLEINGYRSKHYQLTKGAIGCYLSHINTWKKILKTNEEYVFVFEDDAYIPKDFGYKVKRLLKHAPEFDIMLLGVMCNECLSKEKYKRVKRFFQTHAYIIKKQCIEELLRNMFPISQQIDAQLSDLTNKIKICAPIHDISVQNTWVSKTDIQAPLKNVKGVDAYEPVKLT